MLVARGLSLPANADGHNRRRLAQRHRRIKKWRSARRAVREIIPAGKAIF